MEPVRNPASRISRIIDLAAESGGPNAYIIWQDVFRIPEALGRDEACVEVSQRLIWLNSQLDEFVAHFDALPGFPKPYFKDAATPVRTAISPRVLSVNQTQMRQLLSEAPRLTFRLLAHQMPSDGDPVNAEELNDLIQLIAQLRAALEKSTLGVRLRLMIDRQLRLLMRAVDAYPIVGSKAFQDSFNDMSGELMGFVMEVKNGDDAETVEASTSTEVGLVFRAARKIRDIAAKVDKMRPYVQMATDTIKLAHELKGGG